MRLKLLVGSLVAVLLLVATVGGVAMAQTSTSTPTDQPQLSNSDKAFANRLASILGIDPTKVQAAVVQARQAGEQDRINASAKARLDKLVAAGKLSQQDADTIYGWWQSRPTAVDRLAPGFMRNHKGTLEKELHQDRGHNNRDRGHDNHDEQDDEPEDHSGNIA